MHFIFQFPLVDLRPLLPDSGKCSNPQWTTLGKNEKYFIRNFGEIKKRRAGGSDDWLAEDYLCDARNALHFENLQAKGFSYAAGKQASVIHSYRRYYSDGRFLGKFEIGLVDNAEKKINHATDKTPRPLAANVLRHYSNLAVRMNKESLKLYELGQPLADDYCRNTTITGYPKKEKQHAVLPGEIILLVSFSDPELFTLPEKCFLVQSIPLPAENKMIHLYGYRFAHEGLQFKVWFIEMPPGEDSAEAKEKLRNLRINLLRIHSEKETIRLIINSIGKGRITLQPQSKEALLLGSYFKKTAEKIFQKERYNLLQESILQFALKSEQTVEKGSFLQLEQEMDYFQDVYTRSNAAMLLDIMQPKMVLFICSVPPDINLLDFAHEYKKIRDARPAGKREKNFFVDFEPAVKSDELLQALIRNKPDYLHFSMHCDIDKGLSFEGSDGELQPIAPAVFADIISRYSKEHAPLVVIISACNSLAHAEAIKNYCPFTIGNKVPIDDKAAIAYAGGFYETLFATDHADIVACHEAGRLAIQQHPNKFPPVGKIPACDIPSLVHL